MAQEMCARHVDHVFKPVPSGIEGVSYYSLCILCRASEWDALRPDEYRWRMNAEINGPKVIALSPEGEWVRLPTPS